jgi:hypothetical protein
VRIKKLYWFLIEKKTTQIEKILQLKKNNTDRKNITVEKKQHR